LHLPNSDFALSSTGKEDITASVEQSKTEFAYADGVRIGQSVKATGTVTAHNMTAGKWHGQYQFNVNLSKSASQAPEQPASQPILIMMLDRTPFESKLANVLVDGVAVEFDVNSEQFLSYLQQGKNLSTGVAEPTIVLFEKDGGSIVELVGENDEHYTFNTNNIPDTLDNVNITTMRFDSLEQLMQQMGG